MKITREWFEAWCERHDVRNNNLHLDLHPWDEKHERYVYLALYDGKLRSQALFWSSRKAAHTSNTPRAIWNVETGERV